MVKQPISYSFVLSALEAFFPWTLSDFRDVPLALPEGSRVSQDTS
jgi:hypothetical protein